MFCGIFQWYCGWSRAFVEGVIGYWVSTALPWRMSSGLFEDASSFTFRSWLTLSVFARRHFCRSMNLYPTKTFRIKLQITRLEKTWKILWCRWALESHKMATGDSNCINQLSQLEPKMVPELHWFIPLSLAPAWCESWIFRLLLERRFQFQFRL